MGGTRVWRAEGDESRDQGEAFDKWAEVMWANLTKLLAGIEISKIKKRNWGVLCCGFGLTYYVADKLEGMDDAVEEYDEDEDEDEEDDEEPLVCLLYILRFY